jgi:hypothetical protein
MSLADFLRECKPAATWALVAIFLASQLSIFLILGRKVGKDLLKLQLSFTKRAFGDIVNAWSEDERARFRRHFLLDIVHPIWYSILLALLMANTMPKNRFEYMVWLPILAGLCDMVENSIHAPMAAQFDKLGQPGIAIAALFATLKWVLVLVTIVLLVVWKL